MQNQEHRRKRDKHGLRIGMLNQIAALVAVVLGEASAKQYSSPNSVGLLVRRDGLSSQRPRVRGYVRASLIA